MRFLRLVFQIIVALIPLASWLRRRDSRQGEALARLLVRLINARRTRFKDLDYIMLAVPEQLPALPERMTMIQQRLLGRPALSLLELEQTFARIGQDPRPQGVVLYLRRLPLSLADLQTLRAALVSLREAGKRVVCYAHNYDLATYYVASAASEIILQEGGELQAIGLLRSATFLKDALDVVGIQAEVVAISPYKGAGDSLARSDISPEQREMLDWLMDSQYDILLAGIAEGRRITPEAARAMIDGAPYLDRAALDGGFVDAVVNEEGLPAHLGAKHFLPWERALRHLPLDLPQQADKVVAVLPVSGAIVEGESRKPPADIPIPLLGGERMGSMTVVQQVRGLLDDKRVAAVVLHIDSGGGSASASEAMASALGELARQRPLVVFMNGVAGSGGYYIATPAQWIVAQPGTITGSIGVLDVKITNSDLLKKLRFNAVEFMRGANASMHSPLRPWTEAQRQRMRQSIARVYDQFVGRVAASRQMAPDAVDTVGGGRVWTGAQALERGLVDELGGLEAAIRKARSLANLPGDAPALIFRGRGRPLGPQLAEQANPAAGLLYAKGSADLLFNGRALLLMPLLVE